MSFHTHAPICPGCEKMLEGANPWIATWFKNVVKPNFQDAHICQSFITEVDQNKAFETGESKLKWPNSKHNHMLNGKADSLALDLFRLSPGGKAEFPFHFYKAICDDSILKKLPIRWGGSFQHLGDANHFERSESLKEREI